MSVSMLSDMKRPRTNQMPLRTLPKPAVREVSAFVSARMEKAQADKLATAIEGGPESLYRYAEQLNLQLLDRARAAVKMNQYTREVDSEGDVWITNLHNAISYLQWVHVPYTYWGTPGIAEPACMCPYQAHIEAVNAALAGAGFELRIGCKHCHLDYLLEARERRANRGRRCCAVSWMDEISVADFKGVG